MGELHLLKNFISTFDVDLFICDKKHRLEQIVKWRESKDLLICIESKLDELFEIRESYLDSHPDKINLQSKLTSNKAIAKNAIVGLKEKLQELYDALMLFLNTSPIETKPDLKELKNEILSDMKS